MKTHCIVILAACLLAGGMTTVCSAEKLTLVNGDVIEGQILDQNDRAVTIKTSGQTLTLPRARIASVDKGNPGATFIMQANEALRRSDFKGARDFVKRATDAGAPVADTAPITKQLDQRQADIELAKYADVLRDARSAAARGEDGDAIHQITDLMNTLPADSPARKEIVSILCDFHMARVAEHRDKVRNELAIQELSKIIELDPSRASAYAQLADIYASSSGTWNEAIKNYDTAIKLSGDALDANAKSRIYWQEGEICRQQTKWADAAKCYLQAYSLNPTVNSRIADQITDVSRRAGEQLQGVDNTEALATVDRALTVRETAELLLLKGNLLRRLARYDESNAAFSRVAEKTPHTRNLYFSMAQNDFSKGEILAGRDLLMKEIEQFPNNYDALCQMGDYALQRDDYEGAEDYYSKAAEIDSDKPRARLGLGKAYRQKGEGESEPDAAAQELQKAREAVQDVLARLPDNREANLEMGRILRDENSLDEASTFFTKVLELIDKAEPKEQDELKELKADALIARGELALLTTGPGTATIDFQKALAVLPDYSQAFYSIGMAYRKKFASSKRIEDLKEAEKNMQQARKLASQNAQFALELGILYQQQMAQADAPNEKDYLAKAANNYRDYVKLGGANAPMVESWIKQIETR